MSEKFLYIYGIIQLILLVLLLPSFTYFSLDTLILICGCSSLCLLILFSFVNEPDKNLKGRVKYVLLFLIGFCIVFYQNYLDLYFGYESLSKYNYAGSYIVKLALLFISISLNVFVLGYLSQMMMKKYSVKSLILPKEQYVTPSKILILNFITLLWLILYYKSVDTLYFLGGYSSIELSGHAKRYALLFNVFIYSSFILKSFSKRTLSLKQYIRLLFPELLLILTYLVGVVLSGDRGPLISFGLMIFVGVLRNTKFKISLWKLTVSCFVAAYIITLLGKARKLPVTMSFADRITYAISDKDKRQSFLPATKELAGSYGTLLYSMKYVENSHNIFYGRFMLQQVLIGIPFTSKYVNTLIFGPHRPETKGEAQFITYLIQGRNATYGNGSSILAGLYLDFGLFISFIIFFLFGRFARIIDKVIYNNNVDLIPYVFSLVFFTGAIYLSRTSILFDFQKIIWILIVIYVFKSLFSYRKSI